MGPSENLQAKTIPSQIIGPALGKDLSLIESALGSGSISTNTPSVEEISSFARLAKSTVQIDNVSTSRKKYYPIATETIIAKDFISLRVNPSIINLCNDSSFRSNLLMLGNSPNIAKRSKYTRGLQNFLECNVSMNTPYVVSIDELHKIFQPSQSSRKNSSELFRSVIEPARIQCEELMGLIINIEKKDFLGKKVLNYEVIISEKSKDNYQFGQHELDLLSADEI